MPDTTAHRHYATVEKALHFIRQHQFEQPSLAQIAAHCAMSETLFQKIFSTWAGVSPKRFLQHLTREHCRQRLIDGASLLECSADAGLSTASRLHDLMVTLEAVTPGDIKSGGAGLAIRYGVHDTRFGQCFVACTERGVHKLAFITDGDSDAALSQLAGQWPQATLVLDQRATAGFAAQLFGDTPTTGGHLNLWLQGTPFQFKVWEALLRIPPGRVCSYSELAAAIGRPSAARAVGSAVARNPIAVLIPCHRVIQALGATGHYRWGAERKQALLGWEAQQASTTPVAEYTISEPS